MDLYVSQCMHSDVRISLSDSSSRSCESTSLQGNTGKVDRSGCHVHVHVHVHRSLSRAHARARVPSLSR